MQIIEQAYRPYSGVEWHFPCSMRSKGRHRAGVSAPQPPRTPLTLLDELHEERFASGTTFRTKTSYHLHNYVSVTALIGTDYNKAF